jgi:Protein of unknown function (DUF3631)
MTAPSVPPREEINGDKILYEVHGAFGKYVVFPSVEAHDAAVLWCAASHAQPSWEHAPRLAVLSPEKRCGKSRLMDIAEALCYQPIVTVNASTAAVVRSITEEDPPTLMVDEADTIFGTKKAAENNEDIRGILNAGHQRNRPYMRWDMTSRQRELCPTFSFAMLASIGDLPDTIIDRAIVTRMRRRGPGEKVAPFRSRRDKPPLHDLRDRLHQWVRGNLKVLQDVEPAMPVEDRAADTWEPLFAIADLAGGEWPERVRKACLALTGEDPDDGRIGTQLLAHLKEIWNESEDRLFTSTILERLHDLEEAPWSECGRERKPINAAGLAGLLKNYRIGSKNVRIGDERRRDITEVTWSTHGSATYLTRPKRPSLPMGVKHLVSPGTVTKKRSRPTSVPTSRTHFGTGLVRKAILTPVPALTRENTLVGTLGRLVRATYVARPRLTFTAPNAACVASTFVPTFKPAEPVAPASSKRVTPHEPT